MAENVVQMPMIEAVIDVAFERREFMIVPDEPIFIEFARRKLHFDDIVMPVQASALMFGWKRCELMGG
jgi:hypothetical protein